MVPSESAVKRFPMNGHVSMFRQSDISLGNFCESLSMSVAFFLGHPVYILVPNHLRACPQQPQLQGGYRDGQVDKTAHHCSYM
jgi:hypothetical protein